jgi:hypothetical protein
MVLLSKTLQQVQAAGLSQNILMAFGNAAVFTWQEMVPSFLLSFDIVDVLRHSV